LKKGVSGLFEKYNNLAKKNCFFRLLDKVKYELPVLVVLLIFYFLNDYDSTNDPYTILHIFDYRIGFAPRLFIGSIMSLFTDYKTLAFMNQFFDIFCLLSIILFTFTAGCVIRKSDDKTKSTAIVFVILFLAVPYSRTVLYPRLISLDRFLVVFTLLAFIAISKKGFKWLVPLLILMSLATYQGYAFTYMPAVAILLLYEVYRNKNTKESIALCVVSFVFMAAFSAYFFLMKGVDYSVNELIAYAADKTDMRERVGEFDFSWVLQLLSLPPKGIWNLSVQGGVLDNLSTEVSGMLHLLPLLVIFLMIWIESIKKSKGKFERFIYFLCATAPLFRLPMLVLSQNYFRSRVSVVITQFFLLLYFLHIGNPVVTASSRKIGDFFNKNYWLFTALIVYFLFFVKLR